MSLLFQNWCNNKFFCTAIPKWTSNIFRNGKLSWKTHSKSHWSYRATANNFDKVAVFNLEKPQLNAIKKLKKLIASAFVLKMIDPNLPLRLKIDVKSKGLEPLFEQNQGSLGSQKLHPIEYSSHDLRDYKKWFAYIERTTECLYSPWSGTFPRMFTWS